MAGRNRLQETDTDIKEEIYNVAVKPPERERLSAPKTLKRLQEKFPGRVDGWAHDKVRRLIEDLKKMHDEPAQRHLAAAFDWHRLEEYGLPWESSNFLLKMWAEINEGDPGFDSGDSWRYTGRTGGLTVREAKWAWR